MELRPLQIASIVTSVIGVITAFVHVDGWVKEDHRPLYRAAGTAVLTLGFFLFMPEFAPDPATRVGAAKGAIALVAAGACIYDARRDGARRPVAERWRRFVGITLGIAAVLAYFNGLKIANARLVHTWDQYHHVVGAKYFPELGYDRLYRCAVVAEDEIGQRTFQGSISFASFTIDMRSEVRSPDKKIRNLGGDNSLVPVADILAHPEPCKGRFSAERWAEYKEDIAFFRGSVSKDYWDDIHKDHGFNPPPVWILIGRLVASIQPATTGFLQALACIDIALLTLMFAAVAWAFGWRASVVALIVWGCQAAAPFEWTGGSFLRQDWLFCLVLSACLAKKRYLALSAAALTTAALLRVFPALFAIGWIAAIATHLYRHKRLARSHARLFAGALAAAMILVPASLVACGSDAYARFYEHTLTVHDRTPLTNHMGLRVLFSQPMPGEIPEIGAGVGPSWGRMKYTKNPDRPDPFEAWKRMRAERYARYRPIAITIAALFVGLFLFATRRLKSLWALVCLGPLFAILLAQLTCYYYSFLLLGAPLARVRPLRASVELSLFGFAILSQVAARSFPFYDDKYWMLTLLSLGLSIALVVAFAPRDREGRIFGRRAVSAADDKERPASAGAAT